jgi:hypothetical protein
MKRHVEGFLKKSKHFRIVRKERNPSNDTITYSIKPKWSIIHLLLFSKGIRITVEKVDERITRIALQTNRNGEGKKFFLSRASNRLLDHILFIF